MVLITFKDISNDLLILTNNLFINHRNIYISAYRYYTIIALQKIMFDYGKIRKPSF